MVLQCAYGLHTIFRLFFVTLFLQVVKRHLPGVIPIRMNR